MDTEHEQAGRRFWLLWVLGNVLGFALSYALAGRLVAEIVGIAQGLALRRQVSRAIWWAVASIVGFYATRFVVEGLRFTASRTVTFAVTFAVIGAGVGIAQWLVLRREVSRPGWWVVASIVGFAASITVSFAVVEVVGDAVSQPLTFTAADVVGGAVYGSITGGALVWLLREHRREAEGPSSIWQFFDGRTDRRVAVAVIGLLAVAVYIVLSGFCGLGGSAWYCRFL